jgi:hypothetical protein
VLGGGSPAHNGTGAGVHQKRRGRHQDAQRRTTSTTVPSGDHDGHARRRATGRRGGGGPAKSSRRRDARASKQKTPARSSPPRAALEVLPDGGKTTTERNRAAAGLGFCATAAEGGAGRVAGDAGMHKRARQRPLNRRRERWLARGPESAGRRGADGQARKFQGVTSKEMVIWLSGRKAPPDLIVGGEEAAPCQREMSRPVVDLPAVVAAFTPRPAAAPLCQAKRQRAEGGGEEGQRGDGVAGGRRGGADDYAEGWLREWGRRAARVGKWGRGWGLYTSRPIRWAFRPI